MHMDNLSSTVHSYLSTELFNSKLLKTIIQDLREESRDTTYCSSREQIQTIEGLFNQCQDQKRKQALKQAVAKAFEASNWKDALAHSFRKHTLEFKYTHLSHSNDLDEPISTASRFSTICEQHMGLIYGSTFASNKPHRRIEKGSHILDAASGSICFDSSQNFTGFALSLADGAGGHFGDSHQDRRIARASHFATKSCTRYLAAYSDPALTESELLELIASIRKQISSKVNGEGTTLVACRAFPRAEGYRVIGFNIGDGMLVGWDSKAKVLLPLLPAWVTEAGTAMLPDCYRPHEIQLIDTLVPHDSLIFLMSDGIHDSLSYQEIEKIYPNGLSFRERTLKEVDLLLKSIPLDSSVEHYLNAFVEKCAATAEQKRRETTQENTQIGDDALIFGCRLTKPEINQTCSLM